MNDARTDFLIFLAEASGTHAFALSALQILRSETAASPTLPENPDPVIGWCVGDPNIPGNILSRPGWRRSLLMKNLEPQGVCALYLGWAWITLVYDRWEDDYHSVRCPVASAIRSKSES